MEGPGFWAFPLNYFPTSGLRARMASLRQGCGDLRGLVSTFTQSCQGSLSEAQGQVRNPPRFTSSVWVACSLFFQGSPYYFSLPGPILILRGQL